LTTTSNLQRNFVLGIFNLARTYIHLWISMATVGLLPQYKLLKWEKIAMTTKGKKYADK